MKAIYNCFIYAIHIFIVWLVKRFLEKSRNFIVNIIMIMLIVFDWCIQHFQCAQNGVFIVSPACVYTQMRHHRANHLWAWKDYLRVEKDNLRHYLRVEKDYFQLWPSFFRIVSFFLITWRTFNQSMDKNIWMPYIMSAIILAILHQQSSITINSVRPTMLQVVISIDLLHHWWSSNVPCPS